MISPEQIYKVELIERSLRCFGCGIVGLVPFLGIPFAVVAIRDFLHVAFCKDPWNPAHRYLSFGMLCATVGILLNLLIVAAIVTQLA